MLFNFLKKNEVVKLKLLTILCEVGNMTMKDLSTKSELSMRNTLRALNSLSEDLEVATNSRSKIMTTSEQVVSIHLEDGKGKNLFIKEIYKYYAGNSVEYSLFTNIVLQNETNLLALCLNNNISQSYCYSKIRNLNEYMKNYQIQISINKFVISLEGSEANISLLIYMVIELLDTLNVDYNPPFERNMMSSDFESEMGNKYSIPRNQLINLNRIQRTYLTRRKHLADIKLTKNIEELMNIFMLENNVVKNSLDFHRHKEAELFYNLFIRCAVPNIDSLNVRQTIARQCCEKTENPIVRNAVLLTQAYLNEFTEQRIVPADAKYYDIIYVIILQTCYMDWLRVDFFAEFKKGIQKELLDYMRHGFNLMEQRVAKFVEPFAHVFSDWTLETTESYDKLLIRIFGLLIFSYQQPKFNILIDISTYFYGEVEIRNQILAYYSNQLIHFVDSYEEADLVITDRFTLLQESIPYFMFYGNFTNYTWAQLIAMIATESRKKFVAMTNDGIF